MIMTENSMYKTNDYEPLFSYRILRDQYLNSLMTDGHLCVKQFVRSKHVSSLYEQLLADRNILLSGHCVELQRALSPVSRQCLWELQSGIMLRALENITGLCNLLPDTYCKQTRFLPNSSGKIFLESWRDEKFCLDTVLVLIIQLHSGNAEFFTTTDALAKITISDPALQITYWQHNPKAKGTES